MNPPELATLIEAIAAGVRVLRTRDGKPLTDEECLERGRNIASVLVEHYVMFERTQPRLPSYCNECGFSGGELGHHPRCSKYERNRTNRKIAQ